jgi:hypothetical protein
MVGMIAACADGAGSGPIAVLHAHADSTYVCALQLCAKLCRFAVCPFLMLTRAEDMADMAALSDEELVSMEGHERQQVCLRPCDLLLSHRFCSACCSYESSECRLMSCWRVSANTTKWPGIPLHAVAANNQGASHGANIRNALREPSGHSCCLRLSHARSARSRTRARACARARSSCTHHTSCRCLPSIRCH